jgi:glycosyltransferase involved in cell wall biosynthesis
VNNLPAVSVIVPVHNEESYIGACLDALLAQEYPGSKLEIIVVDNGSSDLTPAILSRYSNRVRVLNERRRGAAAARNTGIAAARGEIVAFTDADGVAKCDWLIHLVAPLEDPKVGIVGGRILALPPASAIEQYGEILTDHESSLAGRIPFAMTGNWASRTDEIRAVGGFDPEFLNGHDSDLSLRMFLAGFASRFQPAAVVYHVNEATFGGLFRQGFSHGKASVKLARKHASTYREMGVRRIHTHAYVGLVRDAWAIVTGRNRDRAFCSLCFNTGKKAGKIAGSFRYGRLEL